MSQIGRYVIIEEVGRGRLADVNKIRDRQLNRHVAPIEADSQTKKQGNPAYSRLVYAIMGIVVIGLAFFILPGCTVGPTGLTPEVITVTSTNEAVIATATNETRDSDEGGGEADSISPDQLKDIPREDTLIIGWGIRSPSGVTNPWATDYNHADANAMMWEGLAYYRIFADDNQPWLAESMEYTKDDFTELTIRLRPEAKWSDGTKVTSKDVVYTLERHLNNEALPFHAAFDEFVSSIEAIDELTIIVTFNQPAPRFAFEVLTLKFDTGIPIVPAHVLEPMDDPTAFAGGLDMPHSGPYTTVEWDESRKILDLREDWWAVEAGLIDLPDVKRIIMADLLSQFGGDLELAAQSIVMNEMDTTVDFRPGILANIIEQNSAITSHTGDEPPFGYLDWWPNSLWVNTLLPPYDDVRVRRAMSLAIDRDTIDELVYEGAQVTTIFPFPLYPGLESFVASDDVQALIKQYEPRKFDLVESASLMEEAGFNLNSSGLWEREGKTANATIHGFIIDHGDIAPVLEQMLLNAGFNASLNMAGAWNQMIEGQPGLYLFGHGASLVDPYATLELFHSRFSLPVGTTTDGSHLSRYNNPAYDAIIDEMASLSSDEPRFHELAVQALEIYWRDQIDIPIIQWLHRIAYNQTYWTNWPTADNLGPGVNGAFWHHTGMLMVTSLEKAK